jgi:preprotein translocase subunit SecY
MVRHLLVLSLGAGGGRSGTTGVIGGGICHLAHTPWAMTTLARRLLVLLAALVAYRILAAVPLPFLEPYAPGRLAELGEGDLGLLAVFRGGPLTAGSVVAIGLTSLVTASLLVQLLARVVPSLQMKEHPDPERALARMTRALSVPIALVQGVQVLRGLADTDPEPLFRMTFWHSAAALVVLVAGSLLLSFLAGVVSRHGLGNGVAFLLLVAAVSADSSAFVSLWQQQPTDALVFAPPALAGVAFALWGVLGRYRLPIVTARVEETASRPSDLPFRFAGSGLAALIVAGSTVGVLRSGLVAALPVLDELLYSRWGEILLLLPMVVLSSFAFARATTPVEDMHDDLVKAGRFVENCAPGEQTEVLLRRLQRRLALTSSALLVPFVVLPPMMTELTGVVLTPFVGTGTLIVVTYLADAWAQSRRLRRIRTLPTRHLVSLPVG